MQCERQTTTRAREESESWAGKASKDQTVQKASNQSQTSPDGQARSIDAINKAECGRSVAAAFVITCGGGHGGKEERVWAGRLAAGDRGAREPGSPGLRKGADGGHAKHPGAVYRQRQRNDGAGPQ